MPAYLTRQRHQHSLQRMYRDTKEARCLKLHLTVSLKGILHKHTCKAWMSKITTLAGPPRDRGMLDKIRARVKAVATSPSAST